MAEQMSNQKFSVNNFFFTLKICCLFLKSHHLNSYIIHTKIRYKFNFLLTFTNGKLLPLRASNRFTANLIVDLLLRTDGQRKVSLSVDK